MKMTKWKIGAVVGLATTWATPAALMRTVLVSACTIGTPDCPYPARPVVVATQNGLQSLLLIDTVGVVVLGVLLLLVMLYLRKRRGRLGRAEQ